MGGTNIGIEHNAPCPQLSQMRGQGYVEVSKVRMRKQFASFSHLILQPVIRVHRLCTLQACGYVYNFVSSTEDTSWRGVVASVVRRMNEVTLRRARLVLGWVTVFWRVYQHGM